MGMNQSDYHSLLEVISKLISQCPMSTPGVDMGRTSFR